MIWKKLQLTKLIFKDVPSFFGFCTTSTPNPVVTVTEGTLKGSIEHLYDGTHYYSFKGIPYAQPPVGSLRFKAPLPPKPWQGIFEAINHGPIAPQVDIITRQKTGSEDCLYLNVYTKSLQTNSRLPVMVYIHGGAYMNGSGNSETYGPDLLLQHNVILVTINYRLEILGFLCLDTPEVPGNAGMKDQVAALRWVQRNIEKFGGDPKNITLFGESAGAASVSYHMLSPMSRGLFHKVILQSGVCVADWARGYDAKDRAFRLGKLLGTETNDTNELLQYLQSLSTDDLNDTLTFKTSTRDERYRGLPIHFAPVVEKKFDNVEPFLDEEPLDLILSDKIYKVPLIIGYNSQEGLIIITSKLKNLDVLNRNPGYFVTREIAGRVSDEKLLEMGKRLKKFYVGDRDFSSDDVQPLADVFSDEAFVYSSHRFLYFYAKLFKEVYMYRFDCDTEMNFFKNMFGWSHIKGACHADDLFYLFGTMLVKDAYEEQDKLKEMVHRITKLWANFARHSNPTPDDTLGVKWQPYTMKNKELLKIDEKFSMENYPERERVEFWNKLYQEAGLPCMAKSNL